MKGKPPTKGKGGLLITTSHQQPPAFKYINTTLLPTSTLQTSSQTSTMYYLAASYFE
jgi:hypothetical protein